MEVKSSSTAQPQAVQPSRRAEEYRQTRETQTRTEARTAQQAPREAAEAPKPVVNTQGQQTGRVLNVTA